MLSASELFMDGLGFAFKYLLSKYKDVYLYLHTQIIDGHNHDEINTALINAKKSSLCSFKGTTAFSNFF